jgi:hypothetical protein
LDDGYCGAAAVEIDPDTGCMTFKRSDDVEDKAAWEEEEDLDEWEDSDLETDDEDELWIDDEDEY